MSKWFRYILAIAILAFLVWYLAGRWEELNVLLELSPLQVLVLGGLCLVQAGGSAAVVQSLLGALEVKTSVWDMVLLQNASSLLNYVPMKFGTVFRATYLKRHYGLAYARFTSLFLYMTFLMTTMAGMLGFVVLLVVYGLGGYENKILAIVFAIAVVVSLLLLFLPLPVPGGQGKVRSTLRNFLFGRSQIAKRKKAILIASGLLAVNFVLTAVRLGIIYHSMGKDIHVGGYLILGALGFVVLFVALTPGSLGIRELVLGCSAVVMGVPLQVGILAAMIDRAITMSYAFVAGGVSAGLLRRRSPADFKPSQS